MSPFLLCLLLSPTVLQLISSGFFIISPASYYPPTITKPCVHVYVLKKGVIPIPWEDFYDLTHQVSS